MTARSLASLAHALGAANDLDSVLVALAEGVADIDRDAHIALLRVDPRRSMAFERSLARGSAVDRMPIETSVEQLPKPIAKIVAAGGAFADIGDESAQFARMFALPDLATNGHLSLRGIRMDGELAGILALHEPMRVFGTRVSERVAPMAALFELAFLRFAERESREESALKLEELTQRLHAEYDGRLTALEAELTEARSAAKAAPGEAVSLVEMEREQAKVAEEQRRAARRLAALEHQLTSAVGQLEQAHVELHRRSESLRQRTRTLYLIERVLALAGGAESPKKLVESLLSLVGDDMQALRCSLFLTVPGDPRTLYLAAFRGLAPHVTHGTRVRLGEGVAGRVAETREPLLVVEAGDASAQPLLGDEYLTTGSFIVFPLVIHDELLGVVNLTNRAQRGLFVEEDVERVRLLGLVISLVAREAELNQRLIGTISGN